MSALGFRKIKENVVTSFRIGARHVVTGGTFDSERRGRLAAASEGIFVLFTEVAGIKDFPAA